MKITKENLKNTKNITIGELKLNREDYDRFPLTVELFLALINGNEDESTKLMQSKEWLEESKELLESK